MTLRDENYWLSVKPLAESNQRLWIRQIQSDALDFSAALSRSMAGQRCDTTYVKLKAMALELRDKRDDYSAIKPAPNG